MITLLKLFWSFFQIGLFSIGGGYAAMPLIQKQIVDLHQWLTPAEFIDIITISQMTPGPIAINSATFVGTRVASLPGALIATLGNVLPSCIIVLTIAYFYFKHSNLWALQGVLNGLRPAVVALIASAGLSILLIALFDGQYKSWLDVSFKGIDWIAVALFAGSLFVLRKFKKDSILVMIGSGAAGLVLYQLTGTR